MSTNFNPVHIKGQKEGLWIFLDDQISTEEVFSALDQKLASTNNFFTGAEVTVNIGTRELSSGDNEQLHHIIEKKYTLHIKDIEQSSPRAVNVDEHQPAKERRSIRDDAVGKIETDDDFMRALDETFRIPVKQRRHPKETYSSEYLYANEEKTLYFRGTVRSGQMLEFSGNVVILGDVNPGAYVIASGDIIVMGRLNGVVHAGAEGEERAVVIGASFFPSQLRIAQYIGRPPEEYPQSMTDRARTEKASIKDGTIVIEPIL